MGIIQIAIVILVLLLLVKPLGTYLYQVFRNEDNRTDKWFSWAEKPIFALIGLKDRKGMTWKGYALSFVITNIILVASGYLILRLQRYCRSTRTESIIWNQPCHSIRSSAL